MKGINRWPAGPAVSSRAWNNSRGTAGTIQRTLATSSLRSQRSGQLSQSTSSSLRPSFSSPSPSSGWRQLGGIRFKSQNAPTVMESSAPMQNRQYAAATAQPELDNDDDVFPGRSGEKFKISSPSSDVGGGGGLPLPDFSTSFSDEEVRTIFDQPSSILAQTSSTSGLAPTGLFLHPRLTHPEYLQTLTHQTLISASHVVDRICSVLPDFQPSFPDSPFKDTSASLSPYEHERRLRSVPKNLDRLSDILCLVIDMAELIRNTHPEEAWILEAERAYETLGSYMNSLNTNQDLYRALVLCIQTDAAGKNGKGPGFSKPLSQSELQLIDTFMKDFEKSGIHLPPDTRKRFVDLSDEIQMLGRRFLGDVAANQGYGPDPEGDPSGISSLQSPNQAIEIPNAPELLAGMGSQFINVLPRGSLLNGTGRSRFIAPNSWAAQMILRRAPSELARKIVYEGTYREDRARVDVLEDLLRKRGELAKVLGKDSWAEVALGDKMAKTPENVMDFLTSLSQHHRPSALADIDLLATIKQKDVHATPTRSESTTINAWDRDYYSERYMMTLSPGSRMYPISPYFSAGTIIQGLSRLFSRLYGIRFVPCEMRPGESWHPDIRKLNVVDEQGELVGVIFFDLFSRPGKPAAAAHYTVRCSRRIDDDDPEGDMLPADWDWSKGMTGVEDHAGVNVRGRDGKYQLPLVVLTTDFSPPTIQDGPSLLSWPEVETLFHEMGHAVHSMLGRTEYHNVSGTRCATDFVELPSIIMESFVSSPDVLPLFARHFHTDAPLPLPHFKAHLSLHTSLSAMETNAQIMMATLDQVYHSKAAQDPSAFDTTRIYHDLQQKMGVIPPVNGTAWQTQFGHLYGYGATYYSYLFDRAIAERVFGKLFCKNALSREGGEILRDEVLKWGGSKDPWEMVACAVGDDSLAKGDSKAMETVGKWMTR